MLASPSRRHGGAKARKNMKNEEFEKLLDLYNKGRLSPTQKTRLDKQLDEFKKSGEPSFEFNQQHSDDLWKRISKQTGIDKPARRRPWIFVAAATIATCVAVLFALSRYNNNFRPSEKLILNDGTIVWLKDQATLDYSKLTSLDRQVTLSGEALFEVAKDVQHPFTIHCGRYVARVLGTSFNINATDSTVDLTVLTGQVKISSLSTDSSFVVRSNEHVFFAEAIVTKTNFRLDEVKAITRNTQYDMRFEDTHMEEIIRRVEGKFNVSIRLDNNDLRNCMISADFTDQSLSITLAMISEALGVRHKIEGKQITISGTGCSE